MMDDPQTTPERHCRIVIPARLSQTIELILRALPDSDPQVEEAEGLRTQPRINYIGRPMLPKDRETPPIYNRHLIRPEYYAGYGRYHSAPPELDRCCVQVHKSEGMGHSFYQCQNKAKHDPDYTGQPTRCGTHSRTRHSERVKEQTERYNRYRKAQYDKAMESKLGAEAIDLLVAIAVGHNDARGAARALLSRYARLPDADTQ